MLHAQQRAPIISEAAVAAEWVFLYKTGGSLLLRVAYPELVTVI
jgi:hypothetical protein